MNTRILAHCAVAAVLTLSSHLAMANLIVDDPHDLDYPLTGDYASNTGNARAHVEWKHDVGVHPGAPNPPTHIDSFFDVFIELDLAGFSDPLRLGGNGTARTPLDLLPPPLDPIPIEILSLNLVGIPPAGVQVRNPSINDWKLMITPLSPSGPYRIDSFFDVFVELSLDGGANWEQRSAHLNLCPVPEAGGTAGLMLLAIVGMAGIARAPVLHRRANAAAQRR